MKKVFSIALLIFAFAGAYAREKANMDQIRADYYFTHMAFSKAIPYYEKLAADSGNVQTFSRLGDCYRLTGNAQQAAEWYKKALSYAKYGEIILLRYGQMLMQLQQYDSAAKWLRQYQETNPTEVRVANLIAACKSAPERIKTAKGTPQLLPFNTDRSEFGPTLWNGQLVFCADTAININKKKSDWLGGAYYNIYSVSCDANGNCGDEFNTLGTSKDMNIRWHDGPASFNAAGDTMYFTRTRYSSKFFDRGSLPNKDSTVVLEMMMATDLESDNKFHRVRPFRFNNRNFSVAHPTISPDGNTLVFTSTMRGSGSDLYLCRRNKLGKWLKPQNLGKNVNTEGEEVFPHFINDSTLLFASDGHEGLGGLDIYISHLDKETSTFQKPQNLGAPFNSSYDDMSMAIFPDLSGGYFSSNRPAETAGDNIWFFRR
ncbi:MAG: PD40 domain-containing protein [Taibaiella sp.]|nr:PD40 domain-containing protein [Taibaiella sp.]